MVDKDFDALTEYTVGREELKSWNEDNRFKFNCMYFAFTKACKVEVQLWSDTDQLIALTDLLLWPGSYYEIKPTEVIMDFAGRAREPAIFQFYANPFFKGLRAGKFEPRVYQSSNVSKIVIKKLVAIKENQWSTYSLFLIRRAKDMLDLAAEKHRGQVFDLCMHFSRFCIEFSMKSVFTIFERTFPREHDISRNFSISLRQRIEKAAPEFAAQLPKLLWASQQCVGPERFDLYGDPDGKKPPDLIVEEAEATNAMKRARFCYLQCCALFDKIMKAE